MSSKSRNRTSSSMRRSRSPRRKKTLSPGPPGRRRLRGKRPPSRGNHDDERLTPKRPKSPPRNRRKTSPRQLPRGRHRSYSGSKDVPLDQTLMDRESLKKIVVKMRETPTGNDSIKRDIVNPEDINIVRRAVACGRVLNYHEANNNNNNNNRMSSGFKFEPEWEQKYCTSQDFEGLLQCTSEGTRPIFDRDEIVNYGRKFEEGEREKKRVVSGSPVHSGQTRESSERFRLHESYYEERNTNIRNYSRRRTSREYDSHIYDRSRDDRSRYPPSSRRSRSRSRERERGYTLERGDRHDGREGRRSFRRSPERGRSDERLRRRPSPRRRVDDFKTERDRRDLDSAHYREREAVSVNEYSDYAQEVHGYYEGEIRENPVLSPGRGRGQVFPLRRRGTTRVFPRPVEIIVHPVPPVRPIRGAFLPRVPGRRLPFPPRIVRPLVGPVIRVIPPIIPVRPPVLPVRPPPVLPVRHHA